MTRPRTPLSETSTACLRERSAVVVPVSSSEPVHAVGVEVERALVFELGVLLDVFVAVFVMGIVIFHINRAFDHIDSHQLDSLKD